MANDRRTPRVTLVGAGPGGADLITVRGAKAISSADVVLHDRLADPELLTLAPERCECISVGKGKGFGVGQPEIGQMIIEQAQAQGHVVRLKGGDPYVFGRGAEELEVARMAGIPVEVVPGLSSSLAAPALVGIPITDRAISSGFTVISGHRAGDTDYDWQSFSPELTLVVLMAATTAESIAERLLAAGHRGQTPVAFIHAAGTEHEKSDVRPLIGVSIHGCPFPSPTVMVIGKAAAMAVPIASRQSAC